MYLRKDSLLTGFYRWSYGIPPFEDLTKNFCNFFWALVLAWTLLPIMIFSVPLQKFVPGLRLNTDWTINGRVAAPLLILLALIFIIWACVAVAQHPGKTVFFAAAFAVGVGIGWLIINKSESAFDAAGDVRKIVRERVVLFKGRYCPKIDWS